MKDHVLRSATTATAPDVRDYGDAIADRLNDKGLITIDDYQAASLLAQEGLTEYAKALVQSAAPPRPTGEVRDDPTDEERAADRAHFEKWYESRVNKNAVPAPFYVWHAACAYARRTPLTPQPMIGDGKNGELKRETWDMNALHDLYHDGGHALVDFIITQVLSEFNKQLGGKGWTAYESDGGLDEAISYEVHTLLAKNQAIEEWANRPLGPLLMGLVRLSDNESSKGKFRVILDYDNYHDGARVLDGDEKKLGECYETREGNTDDDGPDNQFVGAIVAAVDAARSAASSQADVGRGA